MISQSNNFEDEFDPRNEARKLLKAWKKTEAEAERIKKNVEKGLSTFNETKPTKLNTKKDIENEIRAALEYNVNRVIVTIIAKSKGKRSEMLHKLN